MLNLPCSLQNVYDGRGKHENKEKESFVFLYCNTMDINYTYHSTSNHEVDVCAHHPKRHL